MNKIIIMLELLVMVGVGTWVYLDRGINLNRGLVKYDIVLANGKEMSITYDEFDKDYTMKNNLEVFWGAKFTFKDKIIEVTDASIDGEPGELIAGSFIRFKSGMTLFVSKENKAKHDEKMNVLQVGKTVKVTTYFTEKSNRGSFPIPTLMPYMNYNNLYYDYSKLIVE